MIRVAGILLSILLVMIVSIPQNIGAMDTMSWEDCIEKAAKNNPDIQSARSELRSAEAKAKGAYSGFLPQISGDLNYNSGQFSSGSSGSFTTDEYSASVSANQNIFAGFHDKALVRQTAANRNAARSALEHMGVQISFELKSAFTNLLYAQNNSRLQDEIIKRRNENANMVRLRFDAGMENQGNTLLSDAFLNQAKYEKHQAVRSIEVAFQQLAKVLGMEKAGTIMISGKIPISRPEKDPNFIEIALDNPQYRQSMEKERAAKAGVTLAKSNFSPQLVVSATASKEGDKWPPSDDNTTYGFNVGIPIFNGALNYFTYKSSRSDLLTSGFNKESLENQLLSKLKQTYATFLDALEKLEVDKAFLVAATVRAEIARGKYNNGLLTFENWDIIENDLISKQKLVLLSERDLYLAEAAWMQAQGKGVFQ